jgi:hypothetical protein
MQPTHAFAGSLQSCAQGEPGWIAHAPPWHSSAPLQKTPSSQAAALLAWPQPAAGSQVSSVQGFWSSQGFAGPGLQAPPAQTSEVVQPSPSSHAAALLAWMHPVAGLQASSVQGF